MSATSQSQSESVRLKAMALGLMQTNCYVLANCNGEALVIDPAGDADRLLDYLHEKGLTPAAVLLTHAHFDHIQAVPALVEEYAIPVVLHPADEFIFTAPDNAMPPYVPALPSPPPTVAELKEQPKGLEFEILHTPGHSPGSVTYVFSAANMAFAGDTLFREGIGRSDLWGGNHETLIRSIRSVLFALDDTVRVYPGHGPDTTIGREKELNPFLQ